MATQRYAMVPPYVALVAPHRPQPIPPQPTDRAEAIQKEAVAEYTEPFGHFSKNDADFAID